MSRTLYVAGPMTGLPEFNYPAFDAAEKNLAALGFLVLNPTQAERHNPTPGIPQAWDWYMRHCIHPIITEPQCDNCGQRSRQTPCWKCEALSD